MRTPVRCLAAAALVLPLACSGGGGSEPTAPTSPPPTDPPPTSPPPSTSTVDTVRLLGSSFEPADLTVSAGRTVVWVNTAAVLHTITPDGHSQWTSVNTSAPGEALRVTFRGAGTFEYYCDPHRSMGMAGRITVQP